MVNPNPNQAEITRTENQLDAANTEVSNAQGDLDTKQDNYDTALANAQADPTPENIATLQTATDELTAAQNRMATALNAQVTAAEALNEARLENVRQIVAAGNQSCAEAVGNPHGITIRTDCNFDRIATENVEMIGLSNFTAQITGASKKVALGAFMTFIGGMKNELVLGWKRANICPFEGKWVSGASKSNFAGLKKDTIGGTKIDEVIGVKNEMHIGAKVYKGPADSSKHPTRDSLIGIGKAIAGTAKFIWKKCNRTQGSVKLDATKLTKDIGELTEKIGDWNRHISGYKAKYDEYNEKGGTLKFHSKGKLVYRSKGSADLEGSGAKVSLSGSAEMEKGTKISCAGSGVTVAGKTIIN